MSAHPRFSEIALEVLRERYLQRDESGIPAEDPSGMFHRVARAVAAPCRDFGEDAAFWEDRFFERMERLEFLPNSPTLMNAGVPGGQLAACFVLPIEDDLDSIFAALARMARIHQTGGGTGFSFAKLRPRDDRVRSTGGTSSGPVSFLEIFDRTTAVVREGGRRRGANMAVLPIDHPDVEEFAAAKRTPGRLENFNLSVGMTDAFFEALDSRAPFALRNPRSGRVASTVDPAELFHRIVESAWAGGDPGILFLDEINRHNPTPALGRIEATNPCGEQPLLANESCVLGSLNLVAFAADDRIDWERLRVAIHDGVRFLDNVIEASNHPFPEIAAATRRTRKIGLGVMGLADLFAAIGVAYDSPQALQLAGRIAAFLTAEARSASVLLGERRGSFPALAQSVWPARGTNSLRNAAVSCVAPTGTIALIAGVSSGIEPFFALAFSRTLPDGRRAIEINEQLVARLKAMGPAGKRAATAVRERGRIGDLEWVPAGLRRAFPTAFEISSDAHLRMQATFQAHVDAAVSKTVNLSASAPVETVRETFLLARRLSLKGVTVYRYGSRRDQVLSFISERSSNECRECAV